MKYLLVVISLLIICLNIYPQDAIFKKQGKAVRIEVSPRIDGILNDQCWTMANEFTYFRQYEPYSGEPSRKRTVARVVYDDEGIYVGAMLYDNPDSIRTELGPRDGDRSIIADYFNVDLGPYNDGINGYSFKLTASGIQSDIRRSSGSGGRDLNWDAVWHSAVQLVDSGWVAEIKIPFSAIRFQGDGNNKWGLNLWRYIQRYGEWSSWNYADKSHGTSINYMGEIEGFTNIKPPVRISVTPYISAYLEKSSESRKWNNAYHGGADLKVGLSEAFTLDATLIPDFGQVQSDDQVLNLTPYEVKYNERRQFFTEGTDVFNKGGIFYSRRVGSRPSGYYSVGYELEEGETVIANPSETRLINATKISGRTEKGLGIGFFNGITAESKAEILDPESGNKRDIITQPLSNYNMLVIDQNLGGGSYISLANTNVMHSGPDTGNNYTANVTATDIRYLSKDRTYSANAVVAVSQKYFSDADDIFGHSIYLRGGKTGGKFRAYFSHKSLTDDYDPNDMGYLRRNNEFINSLTIGYNLYEPVGRILNSLNSINLNHEMLHSPREYSSFSMSLTSMTTFKNLWILSLHAGATPMGSNDHYEPRVQGYYYSRPPAAFFAGSLSTDSRRKLSAGGKISVEKFFSEYDMSSLSISVSPLIKINNQFSIGHSLSYSLGKNNIGFASVLAEGICFGKRNIETIENVFTTSFIFSAKSYLDLRIRHYWSQADYNDYYLLEDDGSITDFSTDQNNDINTNYFNIDAAYTWRFAPGSELKLVWKNSIYQSGQLIYTSFGDNFSSMLDAPGINSISLKVLYYLDYHSLRSKVN